MRQTLKFKGKSDKAIAQILEKHQIGLQPAEARQIEEAILGRPPTLTECHCFAIEGSEHCSYRSSKKWLKLLPTAGPNVILGPKEDAGIVAVAQDKTGERYGIVISHESHNHPSQVVPYEGAATGIGGNVRDVACMGAKVIASADPLRFGQINKPKSRWIANGVINGIAGYGNPIGVPIIAGDVYFNPTFNNNCLVNVVTLGVVKESEIIHSAAAVKAGEEGHDIILVGKPTDNSGFGGAAFASLKLEAAKTEQNKGAVQEPNAFLKRHLLVATYDLFEKLKAKNWLKLVGFKDLGAGGILCGTVEITGTAGYGAEIWLDKVHAAMKHLPPTVILCAETQERFVWTCPRKVTPFILKHYNQDWDLPKVSAGAQASVIGRVTSGNYVVKYKQQKVVDAKSEQIRAGLSYDRSYKEAKKVLSDTGVMEPRNYYKVFLKLLAHENIASRQPIYEQYDKNVQGQSIIEAGQADAGVLAPFIATEYPEEISQTGVALTVDANPRYGQISPYWQAFNAVCEACRNVAAVGATPVALTDCLNYGNPEKPQQMWQFVEGIKGLCQAAKNLHFLSDDTAPLPVISGNVSFYNEAESGSIAPQAIISCLGVISDYHQAITMEFKAVNEDIWLLGARQAELGGSVYYELANQLGANLPKPKLALVQAEIQLIIKLINQGLLTACHDISDGGLAVTLAEMAFGGHGLGFIGLTVDLEPVEQKTLLPSQKLFSETGGFVFTAQPRGRESIKALAHKFQLSPQMIGATAKDPRYLVRLGKKEIINSDLAKLAKVWLAGLRAKL